MPSVLHGLPLVSAMPARVVSMEYASNDLWKALQGVTVEGLKALKPNTPEYKHLVDALIDVRTIMGEGLEKDYVR